MKEQESQVQPAQSIMNFYCTHTAHISMYLEGVAAVHTESKRKSTKQHIHDWRRSAFLMAWTVSLTQVSKNSSACLYGCPRLRLTPLWELLSYFQWAEHVQVTRWAWQGLKITWTWTWVENNYLFLNIPKASTVSPPLSLSASLWSSAILLHIKHWRN